MWYFKVTIHKLFLKICSYLIYQVLVIHCLLSYSRFQRMTSFNKIFEEERRSTIVESIFVDGNDNKKRSSTSINPSYMSVHIVNQRSKLKNFLKIFHHQKKQFDIHKKSSFFRKSSTEPNLFELERSTRNSNSEIQE